MWSVLIGLFTTYNIWHWLYAYNTVTLMFSNSILVVTFEDFCDPLLCRIGRHVACNKSISFGEECPNNAELVTIDHQVERYIVDLHNKLRSKLALGSVNNFTSAAKMLEMVCIKKIY